MIIIHHFNLFIMASTIISHIKLPAMASITFLTEGVVFFQTKALGHKDSGPGHYV